MRVSFNWLKDYVDIRMPPEALAEKLTMAGLEVTSSAKIDQDTAWEIEVTPNRTDCLSIVGMAREVAAITGKKLKVPKISSFRGKSAAGAPIQIRDKKLCRRYLGRVIKNIHVGPSPAWLAQRLEVMGIRAVNNIVDITNFCLLEFGQPLHAFDLDKLQGQRIIIRLAQADERIVTIDGVNRDLDPTMLVVADKFSPQAIAGVMGGKGSEVNDATTNILLESAYFDPLNIRNTSRKLALATQSSYRFERGVDLSGVYQASLRATELIRKFARADRKKSKGIIVGKLVDKGEKARTINKVRLRYAKVTQVLGVQISPSHIKEALRRLQFSFSRKSKEGLIANVPSFRSDISREADLIEEVSRLYGYDKIALSLAKLTPSLSSAGRLKLASEETHHLVRQILSSLGLREIMTYSLISRQGLRRLGLSFDHAITVRNPLSYGQEIMRPSLLVGMLNTMLTNINRKNMNLKLFELGRTYLKEDARLTRELTNLCIGLVGKKSDSWEQAQGEYSFFDLKGIVETLLQKLRVADFRFAQSAQAPSFFIAGRCAAVMAGEENLGFLGEVKKEVLEKFDLACSVYVCELALHRLLGHISQEKKFVPLARFPSIDRDVSLIAPQQVLSEQITSLIQKIGRDLVEKVTLFDQYSGEQIPSGSRGLAYSIEYRSKERTLTAEEVDKLHTQVRKALSEELKVQVR